MLCHCYCLFVGITVQGLLSSFLGFVCSAAKLSRASTFVSLLCIFLLRACVFLTRSFSLIKLVVSKKTRATPIEKGRQANTNDYP